MKKYFIFISSIGKNNIYKSAEKLETGDRILVENDQIIEEGKVVKEPESAIEVEESTGKIIKKMDFEDNELSLEHKKKAKKYIEEAIKKVSRHSLNMKILDADLSFDEKKLTFYFCAESRIDFRSLVSDMAKSFDKLIRLQQVGGRGAMKYCGGIGKCGSDLCCAKFLNNLENITLEMAQVQELTAAGSNKLTGCCGKLMCCLNFELENYKKLKKKMPKINSFFSNSQCSGKVIGHNLLEGKVVIETKEGKKIEVIV